MVLTARHIQNSFLLPKQAKLFLLIADHLALELAAKSDVQADHVRARAEHNKKLFTSMLEKLGIIGTVIFSSEIVKKPEYLSLYNNLRINNSFENIDQEHREYVLAQTAISNYMHVHHGVTIKISWANKAKTNKPETNEPKSYNYDERFFDEKFETIFPGQLQYVYTHAGITNDGQARPPYFHRSGDQRFLFYDGSFTASLDKITKKAREHYKNIDAAIKELGLVPTVLQEINGSDYPHLKQALAVLQP